MYEELLQSLKTQISRSEKERFIIGIDGKCASGKTTLAEYLAREFSGSVFHIDDYFIPKTEDPKKFKYNFDSLRFKREIFDSIFESKIIYHKYNCQHSSFSECVEVLKKIVIIEGSYSLNQQFFPYYDYKIFTDTKSEIQLERIKKRNPHLMDKFIHRWIPYEEKYFKNESVLSKADFVVMT